MSKAGICEKCSLKTQPFVAPVGPANANVIIIGGFPLSIDAEKAGFQSPAGVMLQRMVKDYIAAKYRKGERPRVRFMYSTQCLPQYDAVAKKYKNTAENVSCCSVKVQEQLDIIQPAVIVAMGMDAVKALGFKETASSMRGGIYDFVLKNGKKASVVVTFHPAELTSKSGVYNTVVKDLRKAFDIAMGEKIIGTLNPVILKTRDEIVATLSSIAEYADENYKNTGNALGIAVDTETTSLTPSNMNDRVIAVSLAYRQGEGISYPFEHRDCPFTAEEFGDIKQATADLLSRKSVTIITHNGKFDEQWIRYHYDIPMKHSAFDTMLAEHILDEDKKGSYGLKSVTKDRLPAMGKYEQELNQALQEKQAEINEAHKHRVEQWAEEKKSAILSWWKDLNIEQRGKYLAALWEKGVITGEEARALRDIKVRKVKGEFVVTKKYIDTVTKLVARLDVSTLEGLVLPEKDFDDKPRDVTFEDIDLDTLLWYAAIDAQATRMIAGEQITDFRLDNAIVHRARESEAAHGRRVITKECMWAYKNITMPLADVLGHMEYYGIRLDRDRCAEYRDIVANKMAETTDSLYQQIGYKFGLSSSSPDLGKILYEDMKLPVINVTDSGAPSTDADTLKQLADEYDDAEFLKDLLSYRKMEKVKNTYLNNWLKMSARDGCIHCSFLQAGTATGRLSSSNPNLQNVPFALKELGLNLKSLFLPDDGYQLVELDISNAEMRTLCAYSQDEALIRAFNEGQDLHCLTGAAISDYTYEDILANKEDKNTDQYRKRQLAKKVNFGKLLKLLPN